MSDNERGLIGFVVWTVSGTTTAMIAYKLGRPDAAIGWFIGIVTFLAVLLLNRERTDA